MSKKQADRRPGEKPAGQGKDDPRKPESGRRMSEAPEGTKFGQPESHSKQASKPGMRGGGKDILDGDRSDRESGRPIQLGDDDDQSQTFSPGQGDPERGLGGRSQEGRKDRKPYEGQKTKR